MVPVLQPLNFGSSRRPCPRFLHLCQLTRQVFRTPYSVLSSNTESLHLLTAGPLLPGLHLHSARAVKLPKHIDDSCIHTTRRQQRGYSRSTARKRLNEEAGKEKRRPRYLDMSSVRMEILMTDCTSSYVTPLPRRQGIVVYISRFTSPAPIKTSNSSAGKKTPLFTKYAH